MIDRKINLPGYFKSPWPVECGGNRRQKSVNGSLEAKDSQPKVQSISSDRWNVMVIRRDKDFNIYLHNHEGEIVAFVPAFTEKSTSKITTKIKSKPTATSKGIYEKTTTPITSKITAGSSGRTDGNLFLQRLGTSGTNTTSSFAGTLARFGVIKRDIGDGNASQLARDLYELYKPIS